MSSKFVNDLMKLRRETGCLTPRRQGNGGGHGKLVDVTGWLEVRVTAKSGITLDELVAELAETHGIGVHRAPVWRVLRGLGLTHKKTLQALEQKRKDVSALRQDRLDAPWVINGAMNAERFDLYTKTQLVPTLRPRDLVILDNLSSHKSSAAAAALRDMGAWFLHRTAIQP